MNTTTEEQKNFSSIKIKDKAWPKPAISHKIKQRQENIIKPFSLVVNHNLAVFNEILIAFDYLPVTQDTAKKFQYQGGTVHIKKGDFTLSYGPSLGYRFEFQISLAVSKNWDLKRLVQEEKLVNVNTLLNSARHTTFVSTNPTDQAVELIEKSGGLSLLKSPEKLPQLSEGTLKLLISYFKQPSESLIIPEKENIVP
jgi:hypothetical protein